jgi:hypothetical protein
MLNLIIGVIDYLTGYQIGIEIFYLMPISLITWIINRNAGIIMSVISTATIMTANFLTGKGIQNYLIESWNIFVHLGFFIVLVYLIAEEKIISDNNKALIRELREAKDEIKTLSGLLPICSSCKKIRDYDGCWTNIELYISENTEAQFSHTICPGCKDMLYPGLAKKK